MAINDKPKSPEDIINGIFSSFMDGLTPPSSPQSEEPVVDSVKEAHRLLKKAEEAADDASFTYTNALLTVADRHIRIIEAALAYQK